MNLLLIAPPVDYVYDIYPPLSLLSLASMVRDKHQVEILDCVAKKIKLKNAFRHIKKNIDIIGISNNYTNNTHNVVHIAKQIKKAFPNKTLVCGGVNATFDYKYLLNNGFDFVVRHEGELTFKELVSHINKGNNNFNEIQGICYKKGSRIYVNKDRPLIKDLDDLPLPPWDLIDDELYKGSIGKQSMIETGRGCTFNCNYCVSCRMWKHAHRYKSPKRIVLEFKLAEKRGINLLFLYPDENFTIKPKIVINICKELIKQKNRIPWIHGGRSDALVRNPDIARYMKKAGCKLFGIGFESSDDEILKGYNKNSSKELNEKALSIIKKNNLISEGGMMFGAPNETFKQIRETIKFSLKLDFVNYSILRPYPGNSYWHEKFRGKMRMLNGSLCLLHNNPQMVEWSQRIATLIFYLRFKTLKRLFSKNKYEKYFAKQYYKRIYSILLHDIREIF